MLAVVVQLLSHVWLLVTPWTAARQLPCPSLSPKVCSNSCSLNRWYHPTIFCNPLLLLPSIFPNIRVFFSKSALHIRWPKYWSFSFNISPSNEYSELNMLTLIYIWINKSLESIFKIYFNWRLITLQYCGDFCHTLTWISHWCTCVHLSWTPLPPPSLFHPSGLSHCTR